MSATQLSATGTATAAQVGTVGVVVSNPSSSGGASSPFNVSVTAAPSPPTTAPQITSITPNSLPPGSFTLTITGSGFASGAQVTFGGVALTTQFGSATQLSASGSTIASKPGTTVPVSVTNPGGPASASFGLPVSGGNNPGRSSW